VTERVQVRDITGKEGNRLLRIVRRSSGSVVTWQRAQMVLLTAHGMDVPAIAQVTFTSQDRVRDALHNSIWTGLTEPEPQAHGFSRGKAPPAQSPDGRAWLERWWPWATTRPTRRCTRRSTT
jgi:hypothetical protein